jgi:ABC-2 type transport system ATP-binding protein
LNKQEIVKVKNFKKSFGSNEVIKGLDFKVFKGEIFAFLGANGSGKTTTIRCLLDIYSDYEGSLEVFGEKFTLDNSERVGYLPEERGLYLDMKVFETLIYFAEIKGVARGKASETARSFLNEVGLTDKIDAKIKSLSSGQQQKIQLGITLIHNPELLILDEPTKGLDPVNRNLLINMLRKLNDTGTTIIFSTHIMEEAEKIADRVGILNNGRFAAYGKLAKVKDKFSDKTIRVRTDSKIPENKTLYSVGTKGQNHVLTPKDNIDNNKILKYLLSKGVEINDFETIKPSLEEIFISINND